jgi:sialic acid synthase SpsE
MRIGNIDLKSKVLIVAEIGNNHEGRYDVARELVKKAAECGVDAVKFQTFRTKYLVSSRDKARYDQLATFELSYRQFEKLSELAKSLGLLFISTPLDLMSAAFLERIVDCYKIASGDNNFYPLIDRVCQTAKPVIVSAGLTDLEQIAGTLRFIEEKWRANEICQEAAVLHCVSSYPVPGNEVNLAAIPLLATNLGCTVGYSDHTVGIEAAKIAVAVGAQIIEKHFTLDKNYSNFRDHKLSADPAEMQLLVNEIQMVRVLIGKAEKRIQESEAKYAASHRRSIVAAANLPAGHRLVLKDLSWIRPAVGLDPGQESQIVGKTLRRQLCFGEPIQPFDLE